ncbi:homeobox protein BEL1-like [Quillaja saponaria]|uniref:Homeobox protein BEL1-like n=1 Tax=Quillaja saponaria TaxID=32244 RepID=A0AAD7L6R3_QUISA|nr:homeobox protein BEL1-like [Quillaja saponaria]
MSSGSHMPFCEDKSRNFVASSAGFCYSDVSPSSVVNPMIQTHQLVNQIQGFVSNPEMFNHLTTNMDMIGFSKNLQQQSSTDHTNSVIWKGFFGKPGGNQLGSSSSKSINESTIDFYQHEFNKPDFTTGISETTSENLLVGTHDSAAGWQENRLFVDDSSLRCVFPCGRNERPSQGLSLSLSSNNPSTIGLQSFELRHTNHHHQEQQDFVSLSSRDGFFGKSTNGQQILQMELLNEFCCLGTKQIADLTKQRAHKSKQLEEDNGSSPSKKQSLNSLELVELQKRKTKLLAMLEEVDRRYKHYCNQMKAVVSSFEAVAGNGAATVYSTLASKAMSRHFRSLKDGILCQIQETREAMGDKDPVAPGTTRGETPRLRILDQALRQQKAFQQMSMIESHPWRPQRGLPERSVSFLRAWLFEHFLHPYPTDVDKHILARQTGLSRSQVSNWFINARVRLWKPMVEEMYLEETKEKDNDDVEDNNNLMSSSDNGFTDNNSRADDEKPSPNQLLRIDSDCLSSIINNPDHRNDSSSNKNRNLQQQEPNLGRVTETFGSMELDLSSYNHHSGAGMVSYHNENISGFNGGGVSLTLGLQQHAGNDGVSLAFEDCEQVEYSLLDGEVQNLPYRNLMGAQLLHDFAG